MAQRTITVGTTPVLIANYRPTRSSVSVSMIPTAIQAGNTGVVYIGKGYAPTAVSGSPQCGDPINQGTQFTETAQFVGDSSLFYGQLWATADTAGQVIVVDETATNSPND